MTHLSGDLYMIPYKKSLLIIALMLGSCGQPAPPKVFSSYSLEGLIVPGRLVDAKKSGFTNCEASYYSYTCLGSTTKEVFGVQPSKISVSLNGSDNFLQDYVTSASGDVRDLSPDKLSYRQIDLELSQEVLDDKCMKHSKKNKDDFISCVKVKGTQAFMTNLRKAGWIERQARSDTNFFHHGIPIEISVRSSWHTATISPASLETVNENIEHVEYQRNEELRKQERADAVIQQMKN